MDKEWQARFEPSDKTPRSLTAGLDMLEVLDVLGYVGLAIGLVILAACYFTKPRPSLPESGEC